MKRIAALALALTVGTTMSLGTSAAAIGSLTVVADSGNCDGDAQGSYSQLLPGSENHYRVTNNGTGMDLDTSNFSVSSDWDVGSAMVSSVKIDNDCGHLVIVLKENYTISDDKDLEGTVTLTAKRTLADDGTYSTSGSIAKGDKMEVAIDQVICNEVVEIDGGASKDDATTIDVEDNTIYEMSSSGWVELCGDGSRFVSVLVRLAEDKKIFGYFSEEPIEAIEDKYYDTDADIEYFSFVASPSLSNNAQVAIQGDWSSKYYLYQYSGGKLSEVKDATWNSDDGQFEFTTSQLTSYVISDRALTTSSSTSESASSSTSDTVDDDTATKNPDTGANDAVGVAAALATISLVAAGAVGMRK